MRVNKIIKKGLGEEGVLWKESNNWGVLRKKLKKERGFLKGRKESIQNTLESYEWLGGGLIYKNKTQTEKEE